MKRGAIIALLVLAFFSSSNAKDQNYTFTPVAIALVSGRLLTVDYKFVWGLNTDNGLLTQINIVNDDDHNRFGSTILEPAGIAAHGNTIYIANLRYREILIGHLSGDSLYIDHKFTNPDFKTPEGVAANDKYIAVADYDGNQVMVFDLAYRLLLKVPLALAHGVEIDGDIVYASGFTGDSLVKIDIRSGLVTRSSIRLKYPTAVKMSPDGTIVVLDANAGTLTYFNDQLEVDRTLVLGNGRTANNLLRAYGFAFDGHSILFADTFNRRIARYADDRLSEIASINRPVAVGADSISDFGPDGCSTSTIADSGALARFLTQSDGTVSPCVQGLLVHHGAGDRFMVLPIHGYVPQTFVWGLHRTDNDQYIFGDPTSQYLYVVDTVGGQCKFTLLPADLALFEPNDVESKALVFAAVDKFPSESATCEPIAQWER